MKVLISWKQNNNNSISMKLIQCICI